MGKMVLGLLVLAWATSALGADISADQRAIEAVIADGAKGWNAGDVERFMAGYSDDPDTSFVTAEGLVRGKAGMLARYRDKYDFADPAKRGVLTFETVDFRPLGGARALYVARWTLTYPDKPAASGYTSLVMAREAAGWRIIADHSS
jgi:uncharacterized protein (TIGR02246 family)